MFIFIVVTFFFYEYVMLILLSQIILICYVVDETNAVWYIFFQKITA